MTSISTHEADASIDAFRAYRADPTTERRNDLVLAHLPLADAMARRFARRGEPVDDLVQVAYFGLIKAVERFDPDMSNSFAGFAIPTILGEVKRHFRDRTWALHVGRPTKDLLPRMREATEKLTADTGRSPSATELAAELDINVDAVLHALEARDAYRAMTLTTPSDGPGQGAVAHIGDSDPGFGAVIDRLEVEHLLTGLAPRDRRVVEMRFFGELTQNEIAEQIGVSQMHVSRILRKALARLGDATLEEPAS